MTPQNKLYEAAMALIGDLINRRSHFNSFQNLCRILCEYEQEQPEAIAGEETAKEILDDLYDREYRSNYKTDYPLSCILEAMQLYASQQTASKDKQIEIQQAHIDDQDQLIFDQTKEIAELKEAISELIQVKDWKDKNGKDEHYLKAMPIAWENVRKLIQK